MNHLAYSLLLVLVGWLLRGALQGRWRKNPHFTRTSDARHCWVEVGGVQHAFTDDQLEVAKSRAAALAPRFPHRWRTALLWIVTAACLIVMLTGCSRNSGTIRTPQATVLGPDNPGTPTTLATANEGESLELPAGTVVTIEKQEAKPEQPATQESPRIEAQPAKEVTTITLSNTSSWRRNKATVKADTGTVDTSVAKHAIDVESRRPLLWVAVGLMAIGVILRVAVKEWPAFGNGAMIAGLVAGVAWKVAEIPWWAFLLVIVAAGLIVLGYKRAEWDKNGDGIPDILQRQPPTS